MQRAALCGIITAVIIASGSSSSSIGNSFAQMPTSMISSTSTTPAVTNITESENLQSSSNSSTTNQTRVIKHDMGETEITGTPERVVVLDTQSISLLLELGIQPVGVQTWEPRQTQYEIWWDEYFPGISQQWPDVVNVGGEEVNLEVISQLEPDLIISNARGPAVYDELSEIAPTIYFVPPKPAGSVLSNLEATERSTMGIMDALNRHEEGVAMIEEFHAKLNESKSKLEAAGVNGSNFVFTQVYGDSGDLRLFTNTSLPSLILREMGLVDAVSIPEGLVPDIEGRADVGLEALAVQDGPDVHLIYMPTFGDPVTTVWQDNPVWNNLSFVMDGRVYSLGSNHYMNGSPQKNAEFADKVVEIMTNSSSSGNN
jgi:ferric hydroxamate transport system substrate-binding protein